MILTTVLSLSVLCQFSQPERTVFQFALPGSQLNFKQAQEESHTIAVAGIISLGMIGNGPLTVGNVRLNPSTVLKGNLKDADLKRVSLSFSGQEAFPDPEIEHLFFIGDFKGRPTIIKVAPKTRANIEAAKLVINEALLPGSKLNLDRAWDLAWAVVVAEIAHRDLLGSGPHTIATADLKTSTILKGKLKEAELKDVSLSCSGKEMLSNPKKEHVVFLGGSEDKPTIIKVMPKASEDVEALKTAMGRTFLPGSRVDLDLAQEEAQIIVVARFTHTGLLFGSGPSTWGTVGLKPIATLKGDFRRDSLEKVGLSYSSPDSHLDRNKEYLFFIRDYEGHQQIHKVMPGTPEDIEAVKAEIKAGEKP